MKQLPPRCGDVFSPRRGIFRALINSFANATQIQARNDPLLKDLLYFCTKEMSGSTWKKNVYTAASIRSADVFQCWETQLWQNIHNFIHFRNVISAHISNSNIHIQCLFTLYLWTWADNDVFISMHNDSGIMQRFNYGWGSEDRNWLVNSHKVHPLPTKNTLFQQWIGRHKQ